MFGKRLIKSNDEGGGVFTGGNFNGLDYQLVTSSTGRVWLDRNLGATQVATSSGNTPSYGWYYQWGRLTDGHQIKTSTTTTTLSTTDTPLNSSFILIENTSPNDWRSPQNNNLWQGVDGINNPAPNGFRLPTVSEWETERISWSVNSSVGAFSSALKLTLAGKREYNSGSYNSGNDYGGYWSSDINGTSAGLLFFNSGTSINNIARFRGYGHSVRLIKDV